jgi:hypothetical protein
MINLNIIIVMFVTSNIFLLYESYRTDTNKTNLRKHNYTESTIGVDKFKTFSKYLRSSNIKKINETLLITSKKFKNKIFGQYCLNPNLTINPNELVHLLF